MSFPDFTKRRASKSKGAGRSGPDAIPEVKQQKITKTKPGTVAPVPKLISSSLEIEDEELLTGASSIVVAATSVKEAAKQGKGRG